MTDENVPADVTAEQAEAIVKAAIAWRWQQDDNTRFTREEWRLHEATGSYGDTYKGLRAN